MDFALASPKLNGFKPVFQIALPTLEAKNPVFPNDFEDETPPNKPVPNSIESPIIILGFISLNNCAVCLACSSVISIVFANRDSPSFSVAISSEAYNIFRKWEDPAVALNPLFIPVIATTFIICEDCKKAWDKLKAKAEKNPVFNNTPSAPFKENFLFVML